MIKKQKEREQEENLIVNNKKIKQREINTVNQSILKVVDSL